jgi:hypothetical protein
MRARARTATTLLATTLLAGAAAAQDTSAVARDGDGRRAALDSLPVGAFVRVIDDASARAGWTQGHLLRVGRDTVHLREGWRGTAVAMPLARVSRIEVRGKGRRAVGVTTGALVGAVLGLASVGLDAEASNGVAAASVIVNGLLGAGIGALATRERWVPLWPAPAAATR